MWISLAAIGPGPPPPTAAPAPPPAAALVAPGTARALDFPSALSAPDPAATAPRQRLSALTSGKAGIAVTACARKCVPGCIRGGAGGPGLGPAAVRRDPVVFGAGFRSREGCLRECTEVCALKVAGKKAGR
jgi:hypothetical protein